MKNRDFINHEYGPFEQPPPSRQPDSFEYYFARRFPAGSSGERVDVYRDILKYPKLVDAAMRLIRAEPSTTHLPILRGDFHDMLELDGAQHYVDALISARASYYRKYKRKGSKAIMQEKPAFYVHTFAVADKLADIYTFSLQSSGGIGGYYVTAGTKDTLTGFFAKTTDREAVRAIHDSVSELCSHGQIPEKPEDAIRKVYEQYSAAHPLGSEKRIPVEWRGMMPFPSVRQSGLRPESADMSMDEAKPLSWEDRAEAFVECKKIARLPRDPQDGKDAAMQARTYGFHGYLVSGRIGDIPRRFVDEVISTHPGGILVYTRAVGAMERTRMPLRSAADIEWYACTIGLKGREINLLIRTNLRERAHEVHLRIFEKLQSSGDMLKRRDPIKALKEVIREYVSPYDASKEVVIEFL